MHRRCVTPHVATCAKWEHPMAGSVTIQVTGVPALRKALQKARTEALEVTKRRLAASGLELETQAKHNLTDIPAVDTGKTRAGVHYASEDAGMTAAVHAPGIVSMVIEHGSASARAS